MQYHMSIQSILFQDIALFILTFCMQIYDEYCPILLNQFKSREFDEFETFDAALDEFYSKIESQRVNQQQKSKEESAAQRLNKIKLDQVLAFITWSLFFISAS